MKTKHRIALLQADYLFMIVRRPTGWEPSKPDDTPPEGAVLSVDYVASYDEAREDMLRCNQLAMRQGLDKWAVVQSPGGDL